jgi:hypothetical protein
VLDNVVEDEESEFLSLGLLGLERIHECLRAESLDHVGDERGVRLHHYAEALSACNLEFVFNFHFFFVHGGVVFLEILTFVRIFSELFLFLLRLLDAFERLVN